MNSKERFYRAMEYKGFDRPPTWHWGTREIDRELMKYFGLLNYEELQLKLGDDFRRVEPKFIGPDDICLDWCGEGADSKDGSWQGLWGERYFNYSFGDGSYPETCYLPFKDLTEIEELDEFRMPSADWYDYSNIKKECEKYKDYVVVIGSEGTPDFLNGIARCRGVEQVLVDVAFEERIYLELIERFFNFHYEKYKRTLEAGEGLIDVLILGEDIGNQNGLMVSPAKYDKLFAPKMKALFDLAHQYGAKTMMHSCGSCHDLLPRLIELGLDIIQSVQTDAAKMNIRSLHSDFYGKISFCGSMSVQSILPHGTEEDIIKEVELRKQLFSRGGMIIAPSHYIQVGTPIENIIAMYRTIGSLK